MHQLPAVGHAIARIRGNGRIPIIGAREIPSGRSVLEAAVEEDLRRKDRQGCRGTRYRTSTIRDNDRIVACLALVCGNNPQLAADCPWYVVAAELPLVRQPSWTCRRHVERRCLTLRNGSPCRVGDHNWQPGALLDN